MAFRDHPKEGINSLRHLVLWPRDSDDVAGLLSAREIDLAIPLLFELLDFRKSSNKFTVVESIDDNGLRDEFSVLSKRVSTFPPSVICSTHNFLNHVHNLLLD